MRLVFPFIIFTFLACTMSHAQPIKEDDLAGSWYPATEEALSKEVRAYLDAAKPASVDGDILAVIAPHAGYRFSAPVAAYSFKELAGRGFKTAIVIGFTHRASFDGISVYEKGAFRTPLGTVSIDEDLAKEIVSRNPRIRFIPAAFNDENSIATQIPFVQTSLPGAKIVPIAFGTQSFDDAKILADALAAVLKGRRDVVIIASTDLSHYHPYDEANRIDAHTIGMIGAMSAKGLYQEGRIGGCELCGLMPVSSTLLLAEKLGYNKVKTLKYANSGDTYGDKSRVVGYLSAVVYREASSPFPANPVEKAAASEAADPAAEKRGGELPMLNESERKRLLQIARESMTAYVRDGKRKAFTESDPVLNQPFGAFVTLHENGELRGCIGNMVGRGPLFKTVADMAIESATGDPRFPQMTSAEIDKVDIEISVLSPMKRVKSPDEIKIPGHGVVVRKGFSNGVFLPQVADETGWSKEEFLSNLCSHKAGLPRDAWKDPATELYVYTAEVFGEKK